MSGTLARTKSREIKASRLARRRAGRGKRGAPGHRNDIQGLRAIAVLLVVLNHAGVSVFGGGYVGVDVFFVLSGFLITGLLLAKAGEPRRDSLLDFYARRARRILPAAALTLVATDLAAYLLLNFVRAKQVLEDSFSASLFTANIHFANQGTDYFAQNQPPSPIQHFWSLAVEEQFYVVWPLLLSLVLFGIAWRRRRSRRHAPPVAREITERRRRRLLVVVAVIALGSLAWSIHDTDTHPITAYFSTFARAWELALGAAVAIAAAKLKDLPAGWRAGLGWLGLAGVGVAAVSFSSGTPFPGYAALLPTVGAALIIVAGLGAEPARFGVGRWLGTAPLRYVGDRSYTFYLWHWPFLILALQREGHALSLGVKLLLLLAAFALSIVTYGLFENPIRRRRWASPSHALLLWPASVLAVVIVAGVGIDRLDVKASQLANAGGPQYPGLASASSQTGATTAGSSAQFVSSGGSGALPAVVASVKASLRGAPIPAALVPPVGSLLADHYDPPLGCAPAESESTSKICRLGDPSATRTLVVMGDSHAQMWMPAILQMAKQDRWAVLPITKSSCTPTAWYYPAESYPACSQWYTWAGQQIRRLHPDVTLIAGDFSTLAIGRAGAISNGLSDFVQELTGVSGHVLVLSDAPQLGQQPTDCLLASGATMGRCSTTLTPDQQTVRADIATAAQGAGAQYIDTVGWFCYQSRCPMVLGHFIAYRDEGHVSVAYVTELAPQFRTAFRKAISGSGR